MASRSSWTERSGPYIESTASRMSAVIDRSVRAVAASNSSCSVLVNEIELQVDPETAAMPMVLPEATAVGIRTGDSAPIAIDHSKIHVFRAASGGCVWQCRGSWQGWGGEIVRPPRRL